MAQYEHLPIYKLTYDLLLRTMAATKDFPREFKYTIGQEMKSEIIGLIVLIHRANSAQDKVPHITEILERIQVVQILMRLAHDMRILQRKHYADMSAKTDTLGRQAQGWLRSSGRGKPEQAVG